MGPRKRCGTIAACGAIASVSRHVIVFSRSRSRSLDLHSVHAALRLTLLTPTIIRRLPHGQNVCWAHRVSRVRTMCGTVEYEIC